MAPCKICEANGQPNCGNEWCCTRSEHEGKVWIADCGSCSAKEKTEWKQVINDGCPVCGSHKVSIYHEKSVQQDESKG